MTAIPSTARPKVQVESSLRGRKPVLAAAEEPMPQHAMTHREPTYDPLLTQGENHLRFWRSTLAKGDYVYVLRGEDNGPIKVGTAGDVPARMAGLQTGYPFKLRLLHVVKGDRALERAWHYRLKEGHTHGEWFHGPLIDGFLIYVDRFAQKMVDAYNGSGTPPDYRRLDPTLQVRKTKRRRAPGPWPSVTRWVEPDPVVPPDEAQRMRDSVKGCSVAVYAGPANSLIRQKVAPRSTTQY